MDVNAIRYDTIRYEARYERVLPSLARTSSSCSLLNKDKAIGTAKKSKGGKERDRAALQLMEEREI